MIPLKILIQAPRNWHDALILIVVLVVFGLLSMLLILAKRITFVSLPKGEVRFSQKAK